MTRSRVFPLLLAAFVLLSCSPKEQFSQIADFSLDAKIVRDASGRVVVEGRAGAPDGAWVYVETVAAPGGLEGVFAEAFPVQGGRYAAATPFTAPLAYRAEAVLSPNLNPALAARMASLPDRPGVMMRAASGGKEIVAEASAKFGSEKERADAAREIARGIAESIDALRGDVDALAGAKSGDLAEWYKTFSKHRRESSGKTELVYVPEAARAIDKAYEELDVLFRMRLEGKEASDGKFEAAAAHADRVLDEARKRLQSASEKN